MPALRQEEMVSTERDLGPSVPTILVIAGKKLVLDGSRMEAIRMGSSSKRLVECIVPLRWSRRGRASDQIGRESEGAAGGDDAGRSEQRNGATPFVLLPPLLFFLFSKKKKRIEEERKGKLGGGCEM